MLQIVQNLQISQWKQNFLAQIIVFVRVLTKKKIGRQIYPMQPLAQLIVWWMAGLEMLTLFYFKTKIKIWWLSKPKMLQFLTILCDVFEALLFNWKI